MRRHGILSIIIFTFLFLMQSNLIAQSKYNCHEISKRNTNIIPQLFEAGKIDSVHSLLEEWLIICDDSEEAVRLNILLSISNNTFDEDIYDHRIMKYLIEYRDKIFLENNIQNLNSVDRESMKYIFSNSRFNRFTQKLAAECKLKTGVNSVAQIFTEFYNDEFDSAIKKLKQTPYQQTKLYSYYIYSLGEIKNRHEEYFLITTGYWVPAGGIKEFGAHPQIGFSYGVKKNKYSFHLNAALKFLRSKQVFLKWYRREYQESHFIQSLLCGLEGRRDFYQSGYSEINLGMGVGAEYFKFSLPFEDQENDYEAAIYFSFGCGYKFYWSQNQSSFSEIQFNVSKYLLDFTVLAQTSYTLNLSFGLNLNERKNKLMKYLHY